MAARLQREQAEAREYEYAPLVQVQAWSDVPRGTPLFESHFVFENYPLSEAAARPAPTRVCRSRGKGAVEWTTYPADVMAVPGPRLLLRS